MSKLDNSRLTDNYSQQSPLKFGGKGDEPVLTQQKDFEQFLTEGQNGEIETALAAAIQ